MAPRFSYARPVNRSSTASLVGALLALLLAGCPRSGGSTSADAGPPLPASNASGPAPTAPDAAFEEDDVRPVYPLDAVADPLAEKLCAGLVETQERRRAECCKTPPGLLVTSECVRMLSSAMKAKAITIDEPTVGVCLVALQRTYAGCDWVGPFPPGPPAECLGIFKGMLPAGARCRSSLECSGTLRCHNVGPTTPGRCTTTKPDGQPCGGTTDPLAGLARQTKLDDQHPECKNRCIQHKCATPSPDGAACVTTKECQDGSQCVEKKCQKRAPAKLGQPCPGEVCEGTAECILGKCAVKKPAGEACAADFECVAGCLKGDGGAKGKCGMRCDVR